MPTYTVRSGDTLSGIATANGIGLDELLSRNPSFRRNPDLILPGQVLSLPTSGGSFTQNIDRALADSVVPLSQEVRMTSDLTPSQLRTLAASLPPGMTLDDLEGLNLLDAHNRYGSAPGSNPGDPLPEPRAARGTEIFGTGIRVPTSAGDFQDAFGFLEGPTEVTGDFLGATGDVVGGAVNQAQRATGAAISTLEALPATVWLLIIALGVVLIVGFKSGGLGIGL